MLKYLDPNKNVILLRLKHRPRISYTAEYLITAQGHSQLFQNESTYIK